MYGVLVVVVMCNGFVLVFRKSFVFVFRVINLERVVCGVIRVWFFE